MRNFMLHARRIRSKRAQLIAALPTHDERKNAMKAVTHQSSAWETWRPGVETRMLISARNGAKELCIFEQLVAPGAGAPTHTHSIEEVLSVREGEADMWIEGAHLTVSAGTSLIVPAGRSHGFRNSGSVTLHVHVVLASPIFEAVPEGATETVRRWTEPE
jgi:mannose-6-phosphate isomerase-like protein (cupin superfamily)